MMQSLNLNGCELITDIGLGSLSQGGGMMQSLDLYGCYLITDIGLGIYLKDVL